MRKNTHKDRIEGSKMIAKVLKAQISALLISMNQEYLTLMNITIFNEVVYRFMDPTTSQFVFFSLVKAGRYGLWQQIPLGNAGFHKPLEYFTRKTGKKGRIQ